MTLERELRRVAALVDPVPTALIDSAIAAFALRTLDADLAELEYDSLAEPSPAVRGGAPRLLTFRCSQAQIDVELTSTGRLLGQTTSRPATVDLVTPASTVPIECDDHGRFATDLPARGPYRLRFPGIVTDWF